MAPSESPAPELPEDMDIPSQAQIPEETQEAPENAPEALILPADSYFSPDSFKTVVENTMQFHKAASGAAVAALSQNLASDPETVLKFYDSSINGVHKMMMAAIKANDSVVKSSSFNAAQNSRNKLPQGNHTPKDPPAPKGDAEASPEAEPIAAAPVPEAVPRMEPGDLSHSRFQDVGS